MQIESVNFSKEYAREAINVTLMDLVLIKDPHKKIQNYIFKWRLFLAFSTLWTVVCFYYLQKYKEIFFVICFAVMLVMTVMILLYVIWAARGLKELQRPGRHVVWDLDTEGIRYRLDNAYEIRFFWENMQCLRIVEHGMFFIPKKKGKGNIVALPVEHLNAVTGFLEENGVNIKTVYGNP